MIGQGYSSMKGSGVHLFYVDLESQARGGDWECQGSGWGRHCSEREQCVLTKHGSSPSMSRNTKFKCISDKR